MEPSAFYTSKISDREWVSRQLLVVNLDYLFELRLRQRQPLRYRFTDNEWDNDNCSAFRRKPVKTQLLVVKLHHVFELRQRQQLR